MSVGNTTSTNSRQGLTAQSTITGKQEYLTSTSGSLNTTGGGGGGGDTQYASGSATVANPIGTIPVFDNGGTIAAVSVINPLPVTAAVTITGVATSANQTNASQKTQIVDGSGNVIASTSNALNTSITNASLAVTGTFFQTTQPISAASLPLPTGASTSALQTSGNTSLSSIATNTGNIPALGQALAAASVPIVLTAAQITTLTPPAAITNYALETGGNLATLAGTVTSAVLQTNEKQINGVTPLMGNGVTGTGSQRVTIASDNTAFSVNATLSAETTKVIGTVNQGTSPWVVGQGTAANLNATVVGTGTLAVQNTAATPAGTNLIGKVGIDQTTPGTTDNVSVSGSSGTNTSNLIKDDTQFGDAVTTGILSGTNRLWNGTNYDRAYGDKTNGAFVNVKAVASGAVVLGAGSAAIGSITNTSFAATQGTAANLNATVVGTGTFAVQNTAATPAGTNAIGTVGTTSAVVNVGQKTVGTTAVQINATSTIPTNGIIIQALSTNSASIFVGGSGVTTSTGFELVAGQAMSFSCNLDTLFIISVASTTDKICWNVE